MYARVPTFKVDPKRMEDAIHYFDEVSASNLRKFAGFEGATILVDREKGLFRVVALWDSRESLDGSRDGVRPLRKELAEHAGGEVVSVEEFEVAIQVPAAAMAH